MGSEDAKSGDGENRINLKFSPERRPDTLGGDYLIEAVGALEESGNAKGLYPEWFLEDGSNEDDERSRQAANYAAKTRTVLSRRVILLSAFGAESFINEFITMYFIGRDLETLDRLPPVEKYALAPPLALSEALFERDKEPLQTLRRLFRIRDLLVHPKPGKGLPNPDPSQADEIFNPQTAARMLVATAEAAETLLLRAAVGDRFNLFASAIATGGPGIIEFAKRATQQLCPPDRSFEYVQLKLDQSRLPDFDDAPEPA